MSDGVPPLPLPQAGGGRGVGPRFRLGRPTERARDLRNNSTEAEKRLWSRLRKSQLGGLKFSRQMPLAGYIVDFVCRERKLIVELDGSQHVDAAEYDARRTARLEQAGYRVLRFWNNDLSQNLAGVLDAILTAALAERSGPPPSPLPLAGGGAR